MVYKIGNVSDLAKIPISSDKAKEILYHFARVLTTEYGEDRNIDPDDGGYILYALPGTSDDEIKERFDYTQNILEYGEAFEDVCYAVYILAQDYGVVIVVSTADAPEEIIKEINKIQEKSNDSRTT